MEMWSGSAHVGRQGTTRLPQHEVGVVAVVSTYYLKNACSVWAAWRADMSMSFTIFWRDIAGDEEGIYRWYEGLHNWYYYVLESHSQSIYLFPGQCRRIGACQGCEKWIGDWHVISACPTYGRRNDHVKCSHPMAAREHYSVSVVRQ